MAFTENRNLQQTLKKHLFYQSRLQKRKIHIIRRTVCFIKITSRHRTTLITVNVLNHLAKQRRKLRELQFDEVEPDRINNILLVYIKVYCRGVTDDKCSI